MKDSILVDDNGQPHEGVPRPPNREYQLGFMAGGITAIIHALEAK